MAKNPIRYSVIQAKNPREILMLRGSGCKWKKCTFCDYHLDASSDTAANYVINKREIQKVTGQFGKLEVINSGSFCELDDQTMHDIRQTCIDKHIDEIHFEAHWMYRKKIADLRNYFSEAGIVVKMKIGVETFDEDFRENVFHKGMMRATPEDIAQYCDEVCLLFGITGQTVESMEQDILTGLRHFERVCVNIMVPNTTAVTPDSEVISLFKKHLYHKYIDNNRIDILLENTDFGVGGSKT